MKKSILLIPLCLCLFTLAQAKDYAGLGADSIDLKRVAEFAPPPLPEEVGRSISSMLDIRTPGLGLVSKDAKKLFFGWAVSGTSQVWRSDGPMKYPIQMTGGEDRTMVVGVMPDMKFIVLSRDRKGEENPGLYLQSVDGGPLIEILHKNKVRTSFQFITDDSKYIYYTANDIKPDSYAIYRYDVADKKIEVVFSEDGIWSIADHQKDGRLLLTKSVGSLQTEIYEWEPKNQTLKALIGQNEKEDYEASYSAKKEEILVLTPKYGEFRRLYRWNDGKITPITPEMKMDVDSFTIDEARQRIYTSINDGGYTRLEVLNAKTLKKENLPKFSQADHVYIGSVSRDGRYVTLGVETSRAPRTSYVYDWKLRKLTQWVQPSTPEIDTSKFASAKLENYIARDGTPIPMFVRRPEKCATELCPVVVEFHGGPESQAQPGFSTHAQIFVDAGFIFVEPNVRGSEGYGKTWSHADDREKRLDVISDIEDCAVYIRSQWGKDGKTPKIGITGGSYGGYSTLIGMSMFAGAYDAGVAIVGMSSLLTFMQNTAPYRRILRANEYGDPDKDKDLLIKLSPMTYLKKVKSPLLIIQGVSDPRVPVGEALQIHDALQSQRIDSPLILFPDEGHGAAKKENQILQLGHTLAFFEKYLK